MDFIDELKQFSEKVTKLIPVVATEEATKNALILPFFQLLGYDVFNPMEFVPEYVADVGIKKGEKVDYAILSGEKPIILIEAKWCGEKLDNHDSQLFRYFGTSAAKFAILTNGIEYRFFTDLDEENKMDTTPFMVLNILDIKESLVSELKRFQYENLDVETIYNAASELKYSYAIKQLLSKQMVEPSDAFVGYILGEIYPGRRTASVVDKFKPIIKRSFVQFVNELLKDRFKTMLTSEEDSEGETSTESDNNEDTEKSSSEEDSRINTTAEEIEAYLIVKALLHDVVDPKRLSHKDTASYFNVLLDHKTTKWICRFCLEGTKKSVYLPILENGKQVRIMLESNNDIYQHTAQFVEAIKMRLDS